VFSLLYLFEALRARIIVQIPSRRNFPAYADELL